MKNFEVMRDRPTRSSSSRSRTCTLQILDEIEEKVREFGKGRGRGTTT